MLRHPAFTVTSTSKSILFFKKTSGRAQTQLPHISENWTLDAKTVLLCYRVGMSPLGKCLGDIKYLQELPGTKSSDFSFPCIIFLSLSFNHLPIPLPYIPSSLVFNSHPFSSSLLFYSPNPNLPAFLHIPIFP